MVFILFLIQNEDGVANVIYYEFMMILPVIRTRTKSPYFINKYPFFISIFFVSIVY